MWKNILFGLFFYSILLVSEEIFSEQGSDQDINRYRMFKFAMYQDLLIALSILKMMVLEGYTISGILERLRTSGPVAHLYVLTSVVLHGVLLFDENTNHLVRLNPAPYIPPTLDEYQQDLFML